VSWYEYGDDPALGVRRRHPENSNYGLVNKYDQPYEKLVNAFAGVNKDVDTARITPVVPKDPSVRGNLYKEFNRRSSQCKSVAIKQDKESFSVSNGSVTVYKTKKDKSIFLRYRNKTFSRICYTLRTANVTPREWSFLKGVDRFTITRLANGVEISCVHDGKCNYGPFRMYTRIFVPEKGNHVIAEITGIRNTGKKALTLKGLYIQPSPVNAFAPREPEVNYTLGYSLHRTADAFTNKSYDYIGAASSYGKFHANFYCLEKEGFKADMFAYVRGSIAPGATWKPATPAYVFIIAGNGAFMKHAQKLIDADLK
jgi:hypothetical protein